MIYSYERKLKIQENAFLLAVQSNLVQILIIKFVIKN